MAEKKLLDRVREKIRLKHYSYRTEKTYVGWIARYIRYHNMTHPNEMGANEIDMFLSHLANERHVSASTQNQALNAIIFLYKQVLNHKVGKLKFTRAKRKNHVPTVLSREEITNLLNHLSGITKLAVSLMYGCGLRVSECLSLRIKDIDFDNHNIVVHNGKGEKDRVVMLPTTLINDLKHQIDRAISAQQRRVSKGVPVAVPLSLGKKYPKICISTPWFWLFPANKPCFHPVTGVVVLYHIHENTIRKIMKIAADQAKIYKHFGCHSLRHSFASHLAESGEPLPKLQEILGHKNIKTTMVYTHIVNHTTISPIDVLVTQ